jgi:Carboxypeptidase regulatory-like domain
MKNIFWVLTVLFMALVAIAGAYAQNIFGNILGTVKDNSGGVIAAASVTAVNVETNDENKSATNASGYFEFPYLKPGRYRVTVSAPGFKTSQRGSVELQVDARVRLDFMLELGEVTSTVSVQDKIAPVQSEASSLGEVVVEQAIREMPTSGRNVVELAGIVAGVQTNPESEGRVVAMGGFEHSDVSISGGRYRMNEYLLDGVTVMVPENNQIAIAPSPEGTQEFKVMTSNSGAQFGHTAGGTINIITKGGTNQFHGDGFYYYQGDTLAANNFFANARGQERGVFSQKMIGGDVGGRIVANRTFFYAEYQGTRLDQKQGGAVLTLPTAEQRRGDFSKTLGSNGRPIAIFDPLTTLPAGAGYVRSPFPNNVIPANRIDRAAAKMTEYIPLPNRTGDGAALINNFAAEPSNHNQVDQGSMRADHRFSNRHSIFGRFTYADTRGVGEGPFDTIADPTGNSVLIHTFNGVINGTYVFGPSSVLNYRYGATRRYQITQTRYADQIKLESLGFPANVAGHVQMQLFPQLGFTGYSSIGSTIPLTRGNDIHAVAIDLTKIRGRHTVKIGTDLRLYNQTPFRPSAASGNYSFTRAFTQGPDPLRAAVGVGDGFASFLTGYGAGTIQYTPGFALRNEFFALFVQDDIRLGRWTINIGLRWEHDQPWRERYQRAATFDFNREFPVKVPAYASLKGVLTHGGTEGYGAGQFDTTWHNFAPQIGLAYRVNNATAVRTAYGITYGPRLGYTNARNIGASGEEVQSTWVSSLDGVTPLNPLSNPFPEGILLPPQNEADRRLMGQNLTIMDRNSKNNYYSQQWNFAVERALPGNWSLEAAYTGSRGVRIPLAISFNTLSPQYLSLGARLNAQVANPFFGIVTSGNLSRPTVAQGQLLRPFPQYLNIQTYAQNAGNSIYHGLQLKAERRFSHGMSLLVAYTNSKTIDNGAGRVIDITGQRPPIQNQYDLRAERSLSQQDTSQRLVISHTVELPFAKQNRLLGGWSVSGQATFHTGYPLWLSSNGNAGVFGEVLRPNNIGKSAKLSGDVQSRLDRYFDTSVFTIPDPFTFGNTGRALPDVRAPGRRNYNVAVVKRFALTERVSAQFRSEFYNLTNTPFFFLPGTVLGNGDFGVISSASGQRQVQLSAKVQW